jgi:hypothetical protein
LVSSIVHKFAPGSQIIGIKVSHGPELDEIDVLMGLEEAYHNKARIINCSFEFKRACDGSCAICQMVKLLDLKGVLVVAAAGNRGPGFGTIGCPGNATQALTIGAIDTNRRIADYSSRGRQDQDKPDLVTSGCVTYELYTVSGTSFAAPIISGVAASLMQTGVNHELIKTCLCKSAISLGCPRNEQGNGLLNIAGALEVLRSATSRGSVQG